MKFKLFLSIVCISIFSVNAQEKVVESISNGSCWVDVDRTKNSVKVASFNDFKSYKIDSLFLDKAQDLLKETLRLVEFNPTKLNLNVHCGAYGSSVVLKFSINDKNYCSWINPSAETLKMRSIGEAQKSASTSCDGFKSNEYLIALVSEQELQDEFFKLLENEKYSDLIKNYEIISSRYIKVIFQEGETDRELEAVKTIKAQRSVKRVERNNFYHPVGEFKYLDIFSVN